MIIVSCRQLDLSPVQSVRTASATSPREVTVINQPVEIEGMRHFAVPPGAVWAALGDPATVCQSLAGCEHLATLPGGRISGSVAWDLAGLTGPHAVSAAIVAAEPDKTVRLVGEVSDGSSTALRGWIDADVVPDDDGSLLRYRGEAVVSGEMTRLPLETVEAALRNRIDTFLDRLGRSITPHGAAERSLVEPAGTSLINGDPVIRSGLRPIVWVPLLIAVVALIMLIVNTRR
jgi:carbon monoxide dehydrogenase subunit G